MAMRASWVDALFARLALRYGVAFTRQYEGLDMAAVKADWAEVLDGYEAADVAYALEHLPTDFPPTALKFREMCRNAPRCDQLPKLEAPKADAKRVHALLAGLSIERPSPEESMQRLEGLPALSPAQADFLRRAKRGDVSRDSDYDGGSFRPVPVEAWPEAMRKELGR